MRISKNAMWGFAGSLSLLASYFIIVGYLRGIGYAIENFLDLKYYMIPLVSGFGIQSYLFSLMRSQRGAMATGGVSAISMAACCAHRVTDFAPFLGASAIGIFATKYQQAFLVFGIFSNFLGILYIANSAKKSGVRMDNPMMSLITKVDFEKSAAVTAIAGLAAIFLSIPNAADLSTGTIDMDAVTATQNGVTFSVKPSLEANSIKFAIEANTHTEELDFDYRNAVLFSGSESINPSSWSGPSGGHHLSGILEFPQMGGKPGTIKLSLGRIGSSNWSFEWVTKPYFS